MSSNMIIKYRLSLHSTVVNTIGRICVSSGEINKHALPITIVELKGGGSGFQTGFCGCFIVDVLMRHEFCCVDIVCKR